MTDHDLMRVLLAIVCVSGAFTLACINAMYVLARWCGLSNKRIAQIMKEAAVDMAGTVGGYEQ